MKTERSISQSETIRLNIESEILSGRLRPGEKLDEDKIAATYDVSRTPVREAILQLAHSGLVERLPRKGSIVARTNIKKLIQAFEMVSELEGICGRLATRRMSDAEIRALRECHEKSEQLLKARDIDTHYRYCRKFHVLLINGTHNEEIMEVANRVGSKLLPYRRFQLHYPGRAEANFEAHSLVLKAVLERDEDTAATIMKTHTTVQGDALAEYISVTAISPNDDAKDDHATDAGNAMKTAV